LGREATTVELEINESKTKYMIAAEKSRMIRDVGQSVALGDKTFEVVNEFVHLRSLVSLDCANNSSRDISHAQENSSYTRP
jgi:hypothetical protein